MLQMCISIEDAKHMGGGGGGVGEEREEMNIPKYDGCS